MRASNQIQFEIELEDEVAATTQMHLIMIRANTVSAYVALKNSKRKYK